MAFRPVKNVLGRVWSAHSHPLVRTASTARTSKPCKTVSDVLGRYRKGERLAMMTAYDHTSALCCQAAGIDIILVGDSLSNVMLGRDSTTGATMEEMLHHCRAVTHTLNNQGPFVVGDLPFGAYTNVDLAVANSVRLIKEGGVQAVKLEGGSKAPAVIDQVAAIVDAGIPVMGHLGLGPQTAAMSSGYRVQGRATEDAKRLIEDARLLQQAGCFSCVLELVPAELARDVTDAINIPTIGIGAGPDTSGQVLVFHDMLGMFDKFTPKFVKQYAKLRSIMDEAMSEYVQEVKDGAFPTQAHSFAATPASTSAAKSPPQQGNPYATGKAPPVQSEPTKRQLHLSPARHAAAPIRHVGMIGGGALSSLASCLTLRGSIDNRVAMFTSWDQQRDTVNAQGLRYCTSDDDTPHRCDAEASSDKTPSHLPRRRIAALNATSECEIDRSVVVV